ncbi:MAG TPA: HD domain-containing phosphohydrolase, partial [Longimicrobiaceae bacterium]
NRTELFLALHQPDRARASCDEGFEIASRLHDQPRRGEALKFYGIIYRQTGKLHLAEIHLEQAVEIARGREPLLEAETQRELALVLRAQSRNREALEALNRAHALFTGLQARSDQDDITQRISKLETDFLSLVRFWGESIEAKDRYTSGHCERVADYACRLAAEAGMSEREIVWFRMGAFLHDLGKTEVPEEILNKPGKLTDEERATMERHPVIGDEMLAPVEFPWDIRPMVRSHHERWDGRGYPDGLSGDTIPLSARILRIADVFDALTTARSYRRQLSPEEALAIMEEDVGSFDPELFDIFREIFPEIVGTAIEAQERVGAN